MYEVLAVRNYCCVAVAALTPATCDSIKPHSNCFGRAILALGALGDLLAILVALAILGIRVLHLPIIVA